VRILLACQRVDEPYGGSLSKEAKDAGTIEIVRSGACAGVVDAASGQRRGRTASPDSIMPSGVALALHIDVAILSLRPRPTPCGRMASWLDVLACRRARRSRRGILDSCTYSKSARRPENKHVAKVRLDRGARAVRRSLDRRPRAVPSRRDLRRASWTVPVSDRRRGMTAHRIHVHRMCASFLARAVWPKKCVGQPRRCISDSQQGVCWRRRRAKSRGAPLARSGGPRPKGREKADRREARRLARAAGHRGRRAGSRTRDLGRTLRLLGAGSSDGPDSPRDNSRPHARRLRLLAVVDKLLELTDELLECAA